MRFIQLSGMHIACFALLAGGLAGQVGAAGGTVPGGEASGHAAAAQAVIASRANFGGEEHSNDAGKVADWVVASADNGKMPFVIIDKVNAKVFVFDNQGRLRGAAAVLLGMARGDESPSGIGTRKLSAIAPAERITPAGRFVASLGNDLGTQDVLWVDYAAAISLHRVYVGTPAEHRLHRLATPSIGDNRISYGCINVPASFYDRIIRPTFMPTSGIVYVLPETKSIYEVLGIPGLN